MSRQKEYRLPLIERIVVPTDKKWTQFDLQIRIHLPSHVSEKEYDGLVLEQFRILVTRKLKSTYGPHRAYRFTAVITEIDNIPTNGDIYGESTVLGVIEQATKDFAGEYLGDRIRWLYRSYLIDKSWLSWLMPPVETVHPAE